jgi:hypothetical protein
MYNNLKKLTKRSSGPALYMPGSTRPPTPADIPVQPTLPQPKLQPQKLKSLYNPGMRQLPQESSLWDAIRDYYTTIPGGPSNAVEQAIKYRPIMATTAAPLKLQLNTRLADGNKSYLKALMQYQSGPELMRPLTFGRTTIQQEYPIKYFSPASSVYANSDVRGFIDPSLPDINISNKYSGNNLSAADRDLRDSTLEHELTHRTLIPMDKLYASYPVLHGSDAYFSNTDEVDARLAQVKRVYAKHTGILVDTPEKAETALKWYRTKGYRLDKDPGLLEEINIMMEPHGVRKGIDLNKLKQNNLDLLKWRMPGLVQQQYPHLQQIIS